MAEPRVERAGSQPAGARNRPQSVLNVAKGRGTMRHTQRRGSRDSGSNASCPPPTTQIAMFKIARACVLAALLASCVSLHLGAQEAITVRGTVFDDVTGAILRGPLVEAPGLAPLVAVNGTFELALPVGDQTITITSPGYLDAVIDVTVGEERLTLEVRLKRLTLSEEVSVVAESDESDRPSSVTVQPRDVFDVAGSLDNVFRTLQLLPGVAAPEDFGGRLSVRGGGPDQNLTVMDGVEVHNPYRIFGLISAFNPETVDRFDLTAGGFSAAYGDRLSSLLVVENRRGRPQFGGTAAMSVTDANVLVEGSLPGRTGNSYVFTARRTYYDLVASRFSDSDFPNFRDFQGRFDIGVGPGLLTVEGITSREGADISFEDEEDGDSADAIADASNDLLALRYQTLLGTRGSSLTTLSWYRNSDFLDFTGAFQNDARRSNVPDGGFGESNVIFAREVLVEDFAARQQFSYAIGSNHLLDFGFEVHSITSATRFKTEGDRNEQEPNGSSIRGGSGLPDEIDSTLEGTRGGLWVEDTINLGTRVSISPGLRFDWSTANGDSALAPRLAVFWQATDRTRLKVAGGLFGQSPGYEKLQSADYFIDLSDAKAKGIANQYATHAIVGVEHGFSRGFSLSVEAYYKKFRDLIIGRLETEEERLVRVSQYDFPDELQGSVPAAPIITSNPSNDGAGQAIRHRLLSDASTNRPDRALRVAFVHLREVGPGRLRAPLRVRLRPPTRHEPGGELPHEFEVGIRAHGTLLVRVPAHRAARTAGRCHGRPESRP
ncbi:MAG: TonB-dependent receptor plug domain-containing protein [Acidobacteria bacterium]|nr:TonB-dependent receptor plug domain-containing protein [Acidobacteriota bacterium]